jgi:hypothetical protein
VAKEKEEEGRTTASSSTSTPENWEAEIAAYATAADAPHKEDWDAEIAASQQKQPFSGLKPQRSFSGPPISFEKMLSI